MKSLKLNTSYKHHTIVGLLIGIWLAAFLVLIAPFDAAELPIAIRAEILPPYGLISFICYLVLIPAQNWLFKKTQSWNALKESLLLLIFNTMSWIGSFFYYKTDIINGEYSFTKFTLEVYYPIFFIMLPILLFARWFLNKKAPDLTTEEIMLKGENKLDVLQLKPSDLICISSADNYVEVTYLLNNELRKKLLRTTLKNIHAQEPELVKVHRSHVINPVHFKEWKDSSSIILTQMELPVSKNYKRNILALDHSPLKGDALSQT